MNYSSYNKAASSLGHHQKQSYGSIANSSGHYNANQAQHMGPQTQADGRIPKKASGLTKHKMHGMNQSMDAGANPERYQITNQGLGAGFGGIKPARGDRQSLLGPDQHNMGQMAPYQKHQNYINNSYEPVQQPTLSMTNEAQGLMAQADYHANHMIQTMSNNPQGKQQRPKNQSIDVTGSHATHFQQMIGQSQGHLGASHNRVPGSDQLPREQMHSHSSMAQMHNKPAPGHHPNQMSMQIQSKSQLSMSEQEYQRKKRRQNLSQSIQKREFDSNGPNTVGTAGSRGNTGYSKPDTQMSMQQYNMATSGPHQQKTSKSINKSAQGGNFGVLQSSGQVEYSRMMAGNTNARSNNKFDHLGGVTGGANYNTLGNLQGLPESANGGSFDKVTPQILSSQQYAYSGYSNQTAPLRDSSKGQSHQDPQKYNSVNHPNQSSYLSSTKQGAKMKNKTNQYMTNAHSHQGAAHAKNSQSQDRFQSTQIVTKKVSKAQGSKGGSIVLPASGTVQIVPQLRHQLGQPKPSGNQSKSYAENNKGPGTQSSHHRMYSEDSPNIMANMQKGFNTASNAAIQQQALIAQIYQPASSQLSGGAYNSALSTNKLKYHGGNHLTNSRKFIQVGQHAQANSGGQDGLYQHDLVYKMSSTANQSNSLNVRNTAKSNQNSKDRDLTATAGNNNSQSLQFVTQPSSQKMATNQISLQMQKKLQQQSDTSRVNRLQPRGAEVNSHGVYLPNNDTNTISYAKIDFNSQNSSGQYGQTTQQTGTSQSRDKFSVHGQNQMAANSKKDLALINQYKPQLAQTKQQSASNTFYGKGGSASGMLSGTAAAHEHSTKFGQQQSFLLHQSKLAQSNVATSASAMTGGAAAAGPSSGSYKSQSHIRQASLQIGPGGAAVGDMTSSTQKMAANHRKNKSMMSNPGRISSNIQKQQQRFLVVDQQTNQVHTGQMMHDSKQMAVKRQPNQMENYREVHGANDTRGFPSQSQSNFYLQFGENADGVMSDTAHVDSSKSQGKKVPQMKHHLSQSSHRKNKTTMIGYSPQKMLGVQSTTGFHRVPSGLNAKTDKLKPSSGHDPSIGNKKVGGTLSYSHKSLHSNSSQQRRGSSVEPPSAVGSHYRVQSDAHYVREGAIHRQSSNFEKHRMHREQSHPSAVNATTILSSQTKMSAGNRSPNEVSSDKQHLGERRASIHQQKAQKFLKDQANFVQKQRLKPQGNIVIQQEPSQRSAQTKNQPESSYQGKVMKTSVQAKAANQRRQPSYLKGDLQNQDMVLISEQDYRSHAQISHPHNASINKSGRSQSPHLKKFGHHVNAEGSQLLDQDSVGSLSSQKAIAILDGGTGGGNTKNSDLSQQRSGQFQRAHERHNSALMASHAVDNSYIDKNAQQKYKPQKGKVMDSSSLQRDASIQKNISIQQKHVTRDQSDSRASAQGSLADAENVPIDFGDVNVPQARDIRDNKKHLQTQQAKHADQQNKDDLIVSSINITQEALAIGKIPIEQIALLIHSKKITGDSKMSPRTREVVEMTALIKKSFHQKSEAPKTTAYYYRAGKMLGRGAFGKVCLGMHKLSRKLVALKSINKEFMTDAKQKSKVMHEVGILLRLRHQSVVQLYETFETKRHMILAMELCAGGDLLNYVRKRKKLEESEAKVLFKQIIQGLGYIHKRKILHRDIKLDNILLDGKGCVKIADFGVSKLVKAGDLMHEQSGTPAYIAPEILKEEGYKGFKADIWSAGVVFYAMLCGTVPFKASNMKELHRMIIKGKYNLKEEVTPEAKHLLRQMLETDPNKRISIKKILDHPWFHNLDPQLEIFSPEEKDIVKREFVYNNPQFNNRSEKVNPQVEPWDCFTELNLDSVNQTLRNESEKSVILAPFNSSFSDFDEDQYKGMEASLIIHRHFDDQAPLEDKKQMIRFAARCRDQDRQYEINNNGELDNGVYHKFVYSSRDGAPGQQSSLGDSKSSFNDLRPHSSRNLKNKSDQKGSHKLFGKERTQTESDVDAISSDVQFLGDDDEQQLDESRIQCLAQLGYPETYIRDCLRKGEASYCLAGYFLLGDNQQYS